VDNDRPARARAQPIDVEAARRIASARRARKWTQAQLAAELGIREAALSKYETARLPFPPDVLGHAYRVLDIREEGRAG
jgi:transcriptional regulator with XRE-family HTH domain